MHSRSILILAASVTSAGSAEVTVHDGGKLIVRSQVTATSGSPGGILVESGGQLQLHGAIDTAVEVATGGLLDVGGDDVASVQINGALALGGTLRMQLGNPVALPAQDHISGLTSFAMGGTLELLHLSGSSLFASQSFDLWDAALTMGNAPQITGSALPAGLFYHTWDLAPQGSIWLSRAAETYPQWAAAYGAGDAGADLNHDGTPNLIEFALAIDPAGGGNFLPTHEMEQDEFGAALALLVHLPLPCPPGTTYIVEASDSLEATGWQAVAQRIGNGEWSGPAVVASLPGADGIQTYRIVDPAPRGGGQRFMRLRVE